MKVFDLHIWYHKPLKKGSTLPATLSAEAESLEELKACLMPVAATVYRITPSRKKSGDYVLPAQQESIIREIKESAEANENGAL